MTEPNMITDQDIAENVIAPEIESAIYAALVNSATIDPLKHNDAGLAIIAKAVQEYMEVFGPCIHQAMDEFLRRLMSGQR